MLQNQRRHSHHHRLRSSLRRALRRWQCKPGLVPPLRSMAPPMNAWPGSEGDRIQCARRQPGQRGVA
ncbi:hypothetical protein GPN2_13253 [Streptomyces murinus]